MRQNGPCGNTAKQGLARCRRDRVWLGLEGGGPRRDPSHDDDSDELVEPVLDLGQDTALGRLKLSGVARYRQSSLSTARAVPGPIRGRRRRARWLRTVTGPRPPARLCHRPSQLGNLKGIRRRAAGPGRSTGRGLSWQHSESVAAGPGPPAGAGR